MNVTGGCFCEHVRYNATVNEKLVIVCHSTTCQRHSGSAYGVVVGVVNDNRSSVTGSLGSHEGVADSGTRRARAFGPRSATRIYVKTVGDSTPFLGLRVATLDQRDVLTPKAPSLVPFHPAVGARGVASALRTAAHDAAVNRDRSVVSASPLHSPWQRSSR